jgi:hypothetical protein
VTGAVCEAAASVVRALPCGGWAAWPARFQRRRPGLAVLDRKGCMDPVAIVTCYHDLV